MLWKQGAQPDGSSSANGEKVEASCFSHAIQFRGCLEGAEAVSLGVVMVLGDEPFHVLQSSLLFFTQGVRRQAPLALAQSHRPPGRMEPDSNVPPRLDTIIQLDNTQALSTADIQDDMLAALRWGGT